MSLAIPKNLICCLDGIFQREAKKLGADIAKVLRIPEKDILEVIKKIEKVSYKIYDCDENENSCPVFINATVVAERCRRPCVLGTNRCLHHQSEASICKQPENLKELTRCVSSDCSTEQKILLLDEESNTVYNNLGENIGEICDDEDDYNKKIFYEFIIQSEEDQRI
jgi:hypothetical protein